MASISESGAHLPSLPPGYPASKISTGKNSSIVVDALNKAQQRLKKAASQHRLSTVAAQDSTHDSDSLLKKSVSVGSMSRAAHLERKASLASADDEGEGESTDERPFLRYESSETR